MQTKPLTSKEYFRAIQIIFASLVAGQVFFALVLIFLRLVGDFNPGLAELKLVFMIISCLMVIGGYLGGKYLFRMRMNSAKELPVLSDKMNSYRSALIVRYALLEGPAFFAFVSFLLTVDWLFLGIGGFIIAIFITLFPSKNSAIRDLELNLSEEQKILDPDAVISEIEIK